VGEDGPMQALLTLKWSTLGDRIVGTSARRVCAGWHTAITDDTGADVTGLGVVGTIAASEGASIIVRLGEKVIGKRLTPDMTHAIKDVFIAEVFRQYKAVGRRGKLATLRRRAPRRRRAHRRGSRYRASGGAPVGLAWFDGRGAVPTLWAGAGHQ